MSEHEHIQRVTLQTMMGDITFRSGFEGKIATVLDFYTMAGQVHKWEFEPEEFKMHRGEGHLEEFIYYTPDFKVWTNTEDYYWIEGKGNLTPKYAKKIKVFCQDHPSDRLEMWGDGLPGNRTPKQRTKQRRWKRLEPWVDRILDARPIFKQLGIK